MCPTAGARIIDSRGSSSNLALLLQHYGKHGPPESSCWAFQDFTGDLSGYFRISAGCSSKEFVGEPKRQLDELLGGDEA